MGDTAIQLRRQSTALSGMDQWRAMMEQAQVLVKSGFLPSTIRTPEQAVAIMLKGHELGIPPMYALSNIVVISGKPTCNAELMQALIYREQGDNALIIEETTADRCTISYARRAWQARKTASFTMEDAKRANLLGNQTWAKYPAAMLRARCISAVARMAFADCIGGMYTPEELGAPVAVDEATGEISYAGTIEGEAREVQPMAAQVRNPQSAIRNTATAAESPVAEARARFTEAAKLAGYTELTDRQAWVAEQVNHTRFSTLTAAEWDRLTQAVAADPMRAWEQPAMADAATGEAP